MGSHHSADRAWEPAPQSTIQVCDAPAIPGLPFRHFAANPTIR